MFVGMPCQLQTVVQLLCEEMELSFLEAGRPCPPWRSVGATISRWMNHQVVDVPVPSAVATPKEVEDYFACCSRLSSSKFRAYSSSSGSGTSCSAVVDSPAVAAMCKSSSSGGSGGSSSSSSQEAAGACLAMSPGRLAVPKGWEAAAAWGAMSSSSSSKRVAEPKQCQWGFEMSAPTTPRSKGTQSRSSRSSSCSSSGGSVSKREQRLDSAAAAALLAWGWEAGGGSVCGDEVMEDDGEEIVYTVGSLPSAEHSSRPSSFESSEGSLAGVEGPLTPGLMGVAVSPVEPRRGSGLYSAMVAGELNGVDTCWPKRSSKGLNRPRSLLTQRLQESRGLEQTMRGGRAVRAADPWALQHAGMWLARTEALIAEKRLQSTMQEERRQAQLLQQHRLVQEQQQQQQLSLKQQQQQVSENGEVQEQQQPPVWLLNQQPAVQEQQVVLPEHVRSVGHTQQQAQQQEQQQLSFVLQDQQQQQVASLGPAQRILLQQQHQLQQVLLLQQQQQLPERQQQQLHCVLQEQQQQQQQLQLCQLYQHEVVVVQPQQQQQQHEQEMLHFYDKGEAAVKLLRLLPQAAAHGAGLPSCVQQDRR